MTDPDEQLMLIDLPALPAAPEAAEQLKRRVAKPAGKVEGAAADPFAPVPDILPGIMLVDPRVIAVDPVNARHGVPFDCQTQAELIASMRSAGNTVPVRLRRDPSGAASFLCLSGSQRLGAALHIQRDDASFRLRAIITEVMDDRAAFALGEADNAGRTSVAPMQQARKWAETLATVYGGDRQAFILATGRSASVVSRTLALATLPAYILACCADPEALTPYFAELLTPRLADPGEEPEIRRRAEALAASGHRLSGARLIRALLQDAATVAREPRILWQSSDGARNMRFKAAAKGGGQVEIADLAGVSTAERRSLVKAFDTLLKDLAATVPAK